MPSLNVDLGFFSHRKTVRLVGRLGRGAELLLIRLWCHCGVHHSESGRMTDYLASEIETAAGWWGKPGEMIQAMLDIGWLKRDGEGYLIHDWLDHQGHIAAFKARGKAMARARWDAVSNAASNAGSNAASMLQVMPDRSDRSELTDKPIKRLGNRAVSGDSVNGEDANAFLLACRATFSKAEMKAHGGLWRTLHAQNPDKAWRVIREVQSTLRERPTEIKTTPQQFAMYLWKQFK